MQLRTHAGFRLFWAASTVSYFGTPITTLAIQVLVVTTLSGSAADVGLVNAARWLPYLLFGVLVGALADRVRRKPLLVGTDLGRAALLCAVPLLAWPGLLSLPMLAPLVAVFGLLSLVNDAAHQSFLPRLLPRDALTRANARLSQSSAAADTAGPAVAGGLVGWLGAPAAVRRTAAGGADPSRVHGPAAAQHRRLGRRGRGQPLAGVGYAPRTDIGLLRAWRSMRLLACSPARTSVPEACPRRSRSCWRPPRTAIRTGSGCGPTPTG
jgi:MFS family permease